MTELRYPLVLHIPRKDCVISDDWVTVVMADPEVFLEACRQHLERRESIAMMKVRE